MNIRINGEPRSAPEDADLAAVLREFGVPEQGVAVAVDGAVVPRAAWSGTPVRPDAVVEILTAVQGG